LSELTPVKAAISRSPHSWSIDRFGVLVESFAGAATLSKDPNLEIAVILEQVILDQMLLGLMVVAVVLLLLPFLLVMVGIGAAMLLWFVASAAVLGALVFWLVFPGTYGLAVLLLALVIGLLLVDRRSRHGAS
jgi:hypothetical protein